MTMNRMQSFTQRLIGAARLNVATYEEVEHDHSATGQAAAVVALSALSAGLGAMFVGGIELLIIATLGGLLGWIIWAGLIWLIGTKLLPEPQTEADIGQLLRTMGFAAAPGLLRIFDFMPLIGGLIALAIAIWMLVAMVIAVRQALDYSSTWRAIGVCLLGWLIQALILALLGGLGSLGAGPAG